MYLNYLYAFANNLISVSDFENWLYRNYERLDNAALAEELLNCDYKSRSETEHIIYLINNAYGEEFKKINTAEFDSELLALTGKYSEPSENIEIDCTNVRTGTELHYILRDVFKLPRWYGMNWDAFEDIAAIGNVKEIHIIGYENLLMCLPQDAGELIKILERNKNSGCIILR